MNHTIIRIVLVLLGFHSLPLMASAPPVAYTITDLGTLGGDTAFAFGINSSGQVVGRSETYWGGPLAFRYSNGQMTNLGTLPSVPFSIAYAINDSGQVAGESAARAVLFSGGFVQDLNALLGVGQGYAYGINNLGQVVGLASGNRTSPFLYSSGSVFPIGSLISSADRTNWTFNLASDINDSGWIVGAGYTNPPAGQPARPTGFIIHNGQLTELPGAIPSNMDINNAGQVAGSISPTASSYHAVLYTLTNMIDLGTLTGDTSSWGYGLNNRGHVVGESLGPLGHRAVLCLGGDMWDLNALMIGPATNGWKLNEARGINDSGQIVGNGMYNGQSRAFLLTPIPVIQSAALSNGVGFSFSFWTMTNRNYRVQWSAELSTWADLTNLSGSAAFVTARDLAPSAANRFYRVVTP